MSAKSVVGLVLLFASSVACGISPAEPDEMEGVEDVSSTTAELKPVGDDAPAPHDIPAPSFDFNNLHRRWDLTPYFEELQRPRYGGCVVHMTTIFDPGRGRNIEVPITVCR